MNKRKIFYLFEVILFLLIIVGAFLFAYDNTREKIVDEIVEKASSDIDTYAHIFNSIKNNKLTTKDINYLEYLVNKLKRNNFILSDDLEIFNAILEYYRGNTNNTIKILKGIIDITSDEIVKADAILELVNILIEQKYYSDAIKLLEDNSFLYANYKKQTYNIKLADLYYKLNNYKLSGELISLVDKVPYSYRSLYTEIISSNWENYSQYKKKKILDSLLLMELYENYSYFSKKYIEEYKPEYKEVENIAFNFVDNSRKSYVRDFIEYLIRNTNYSEIGKEINILFNMKLQNVDNFSAKLRGSYYNRILYDINYKGRYNYRKALDTYNSYLKGEVESEYIRKNLILTIRNLIAYKKYELINEIVEKTYDKLNISRDKGIINDFVSFWNGFAYYKNSNWVKALNYFEKALVFAPDTYYSILSVNYIKKIKELNNDVYYDYLNDIRNKYSSSTNINDKLYYSKILYGLSGDNEKEYYRVIIKKLLINNNNNALFTFNFDDFYKIKNSRDYIKFVIYTRSGLIERARALLGSINISDFDIQNVIFLKELLRIKNFKLAKQFLFLLDNSSFINENFPFLSLDLKKLFYPEPFIDEITYASTVLKKIKIDKYLIHSIIRQESLYIPETRSSAGAIGVMQLMPETARLVANSLNRNSKYNLYNTYDNILFGTKFLYDNINYLGFITAIATYNGGIGIVMRMKKNFNCLEDIELVEIIPYGETREYVRRVLTYYYNYMSIYSSKSVDIIL